MRKSIIRVLSAIAVACTSSASMGQSSSLDPFDLGAGVACEFPLRLQPLQEGRQAIRLHDTQGRMDTVIYAGQFGTLQLVNLSNGQSVTLPGKGAVSRTVENADGSTTVTLTGHWVNIWFPTDIPPGPRTIEYVGRLVYRNTTLADGTMVSTFVSLNGQEVRDICAALA